MPEAAPDSVPGAIWDSLIAPANFITDPPGITGTFIRNLVYVQFVGGTTQSERQSAIDAIRGEVVGGMTLGDPEHFYAVRIPYRLSRGDSTSGPILRAIATLDGNSKVAAAAPANLDAMEPEAKSRSIVPLGAPDSVTSGVLVNVKLPTATQAERLSAIDAVDGVVVVGTPIRAAEGHYAVRAPYVLSPGDSVGARTLRARAQLRANPKVKMPIRADMDPPISYAATQRVTLPPTVGLSSRQKLIVHIQRDTTPRVTLVPPDTTPVRLFQSLGEIPGPASLGGGQYLKDILVVEFKLGTPLPLRQAKIDSVGGAVVGGKRYEEGGDGSYYVRVAGGTFSTLRSAIIILRRQPQIAVAGTWDLTMRSDETLWWR